MKRENIINVSLTDEDKKIILALVAIEDITTLKIHKALEKLTKIRDLKQLNLEEFLKLFGENKKESYRKFKKNLDFNFEEYFKFYKTNYLFFDDIYYPKQLFRLVDFPFVLFYRGDKNLLLFKRKMSIVGSRQNTFYSLESLKKIVPYLAKYNFLVVSGLASGVDSIAHKLAIREKIKTIAIIAHGHNIIYPEENIKLYKLMEEKHLIVSEYMPTSQIRKYRFLERNRIVATLSDGLIVTEAAKTSGTSRTVDFALDVGNCVFCLPGRFGDKMSFALNEHIKDGAILLNKLEDIKNEYHLK